jgi:peroxiredoxin
MDVRALQSTQVLDCDGRAVRLASHWSSQTAVVVWLRHFGCLYCAEQARDLFAVAPRIERAGAALVLVGNGGAEHARSFRDRVTPGATVLTDPRLGSYRAIGARHGLLSTVGPRTWGHALRAWRRGARQSTVKGHAFQQGAVLVMAPPNRVAYAHISSAAGDHAPVDAVLAALEGDAASGSSERARSVAG